MDAGIVPDFLRKMAEEEYRHAYPRFYTNKYGGLVWSLLTLTELGAQINPQIAEQCEYILEAQGTDQRGGE